MDKLRLLIIEDSTLAQGMYADSIDPAVFEIKCAGDGKEGLRLYRDWKPDVILLDILMPVMTGYSFLKEIRQGLKDKLTAVVVATSLKTKQDVVECAKLGIQGYIVKPPPYETMTEKLLAGYAVLYPEKAKAVRPG